MSGVIPGLLWYATAFVVVAGLGLVWDVWRHKDRFEIAARSPLLLCLAGAAHVALVFLQMMAQASLYHATRDLHGQNKWFCIVLRQQFESSKCMRETRYHETSYHMYSQ